MLTYFTLRSAYIHKVYRDSKDLVSTNIPNILSHWIFNSMTLMLKVIFDTINTGDNQAETESSNLVDFIY